MFLQSPAYLVISLLPLSMVEIAPEFKPALLTVKGTGSATLGSLLLSVNKAGLNSGAIFTILNGNKLVTK